MSTNRSIIFIIFLVLCTSCRLLEEGKNVRKTKFIAIAQQHLQANFNGLLIKKVHNPKITIDYGFSDNDRCGKLVSVLDEQQLKIYISESLRVWLAPLADRGEIVNRFEYRYRETHKDGDSKSRKFNYTLDSDNPDLSIIFYCQEGRSFARVGTHAMIHMYQETGSYTMNILHHEMGHAFGLGDTYVDVTESPSWSFRYNTSDGGGAGTAGKQPISVMNLNHLTAIDSTGELQLGADDIAGINWLYNYHVAKTIGKNDCPADYLYEDSTKGCAPRYPLIFAVKQNNLYFVDRILSADSKNINLDQQDELGNSALHYAAYANKKHGSLLYDYLIDKGANIQLKNNKGETARDILGE